MNTPAMAKKELNVIEKLINQDLTLIYMPDLNLCDFHVKSEKNYLLHVLNPLAFGMEFATIRKGNNVFNIIRKEETKCYLFEEAQLRDLVSGAEAPIKVPMMASARPQEVKPTPCTGPIIIPPTKSTR